MATLWYDLIWLSLQINMILAINENTSGVMIPLKASCGFIGFGHELHIIGNQYTCSWAVIAAVSCRLHRFAPFWYPLLWVNFLNLAKWVVIHATSVGARRRRRRVFELEWTDQNTSTCTSCRQWSISVVVIYGVAGEPASYTDLAAY